jgi:hypothetical protein
MASANENRRLFDRPFLPFIPGCELFFADSSHHGHCPQLPQFIAPPFAVATAKH